MPYGNGDDGIKLHFLDLSNSEAEAVGKITANIKFIARKNIDAEINRTIRKKAPSQIIPLADHSMVDDISDAGTACTLLRSVHTGKDPNDSPEVDRICGKYEDMLLDLEASALNDASGASVANDVPASDAEDTDRHFQIRTTSNDGATVTKDGEPDPEI